MKDIVVSDYLTWEYCTDPGIQYLECPAPEPVRNHMPQWFKDLKVRRPPIDIADHMTVRNCLGFRGLATVGYTIPLPETIKDNDTYFSRGRLHPEMLYGTIWANTGTEPWAPNDNSPYEYCIRLLRWPWRAKMSRGWRLLILPYLLDWSKDWHEFAGTVEPNYNFSSDMCSVGHNLKWSTPIDTNYNYYNLETVLAFKRWATVPKGTLIFCAVPLYDPELAEKQNGMDQTTLE